MKHLPNANDATGSHLIADTAITPEQWREGMKLSVAQTDQLMGKVAAKMEVRCTTFDYAKQIELWSDDDLKARFRSLSEAKRHAVVFQKRNPGAYVKVVEIKRKVHEFSMKEAPRGQPK